MPFIHLPDRQVNQYYCTNPTWHYSTSLSTAPVSGELDPNKPNLFLIHCGGSSSAAQQRQFHDDRLKAAFNLIAMDMPCHGWSTGAAREGAYPLAEAGRTFFAALDSLYAPHRIKFSILAEGRVGSHVATWMAHERPEQVQAIVLASPCSMKEGSARVEVMYKWLELCKRNKNGQGDETGLLPAEAVTFTNDYYFAGSERDMERQAIFASAFQQRYGAGHSSHDITHLVKWVESVPLSLDELAKIACPVMILAGEIDQISPYTAAEEWRDALTGVPGGAQVHLVKSAPHLLMYAESGVTNRMVFRFFTSALGLDPLVPARPSFF